MAHFGDQNFTTFVGVNTKGTIVFRVAGDGTTQGTLAIKEAADEAYAWKLPHKSGTFPIAGTFIVQLPAITGGNWAETSMVVTGIRTEDALICSLQDTFNTVTTDRPMAFLAGASPRNGNIHLTFMNPSATATIYNELIVAYCTAR